ncbi:ADP-forming succinate--CoA ligase subunit beta [Anaplasmataceae bacterium AB001_6]|nr:ADP-forming succinate--CoA ligase subunit beta [Anaplasmataceae bacterium AB001_6]
MNIHEYQAKKIMADYNIAVPENLLVALSKKDVEGAESILNKSGSNLFVVKAQIHAGGRGKAGGVKVVKEVSEAVSAAREMMEKNLVTHQTGSKGQLVRRIYIEKGAQIKKEYYLSAVINRNTYSVSFIASAEGGMDIEEVAAKNPEKIIKVNIDATTGFYPCYARKLGFGIGLNKEQVNKFVPVVEKIYKIMQEKDCTQVEINPLILDDDDNFVALDGKINFDDNALYRHTDIVELRDLDEEEAQEIEASKFGLNYIKMEGEIGCMVNGAGLAMATMDIIKYHGLEAANFLDVGGGASQEAVENAFRIIISDKNVKGILVNIFGGIMKCDIIAQGIVAAAKNLALDIPVVVRLVGTNYDKGLQILNDSGLKISVAGDLDEASRAIVRLVKEVK